MKGDARNDADSKAIIAAHWRLGSKGLRNIYAMLEEEGIVIGLVDSSRLAEHVVALHNDWLNFESGKVKS